MEKERGCERALGTVCEMRAESVGKKTGCRVQINGEEAIRNFSSSMLHTQYIRVLMVPAASNHGLGKFLALSELAHGLHIGFGIIAVKVQICW